MTATRPLPTARKPIVTTATIAGRTPTQVTVRIPEVHPYRILTLPAASLPGDRGATLTVEVRSPIEPTRWGWGALVIALSDPIPPATPVAKPAPQPEEEEGK